MDPVHIGLPSPVPIAAGGTGQTTAAPAFDALAPTTQRGDLIRRNAVGVNERLAAGAVNTLLTVPAAGDYPAWSTLTAFLDALFGSTLGTTIARGAAAWQAVAPSTNNSVLVDGAGATVPVWVTLSNLIDVVIGSTRGSILMRGAGGWALRVPHATAGFVLASNGTGADPTYQDPQTGVDGEDGLLRDVLAHTLGGTTASMDTVLPANSIANANGSGLHFVARVLVQSGIGAHDIGIKIDGVEYLTDAQTSGLGADGYLVIEGWIMRSGADQVEVTYCLTGDAIEGAAAQRTAKATINPLALADAHTLTVFSDEATDDVESTMVRYINGVAVDPPIAADEPPGSAQPTSSSMPTVRAKRSRGATPGGFRLSGGTTLGSLVDATTFGAVESGTMVLPGARFNDWVEYKGVEYYLNTSGTTTVNVYERPCGGAINTTPVHTLTITTNGLLRTGLIVVNNGASSILCYVAATSAAPAVFHLVTFDGTTWTATNMGAAVNAATALCSYGVAVAGGLIYIPVQRAIASGCAVVVNPVSLTYVEVANPSADINAGCFTTIYGRVFYMSGPTTGVATQRTLYECVSGVLVSRLVFASRNNDTSTADGTKPACIFPMGDTIVCIWGGGAAATDPQYFASYATFTSPTDTAPTETTCDAFLPAELKVVDTGIVYAIYVWMDTETDPTVPQYNFWWTNAIGTAYAYARLVDLSTQMTGAATGMDPTNWSGVAGTRGGGEQISPDDANDVIFQTVSIARSGTHSTRAVATIKFTSEVITDTFTAKLWYSVKQNRDFVQATLIGTPTGGSAVRVGSEIQVCAHDTTHTFEWDLSADTIADNTQLEFVVKLYRE